MDGQGPNARVLDHAGVPNKATLSTQCCLRCVLKVHQVDDERILIDMLYSELASGMRPACHPNLHYKDVCKHDLKILDSNVNTWEAMDQTKIDEKRS